MSTWTQKILGGAIIVFSIWGMVLSNWKLTVAQTDIDPQDERFYLPKVEFVKPMLLGHEAFLADLIWIRTLGYFADELTRGRKFSDLEQLIDFATDLDPRFEKIYMWAGAVFMYRGGRITKERIMGSTRILEKGWQYIQNDPFGWRHDPQYWMIPQMIGFNYAIELKDRARGAPYIEAAAKIPGSPDLYKTWAATLLKRAGKLEQATRILEDMLAVETLEGQMEAVKDTTVKERIRIRLNEYYKKLYGESAVRERIRLLEMHLNSQVEEWKDSLPYIPFYFYLLLRQDKDDLEERSMQETWEVIFPMLSLS